MISNNMTNILIFFLLCLLLINPNKAKAEDDIEFSFDESLMLGSGFNSEYLAKLAKGDDILPGDYRVDVFINNVFHSREEIHFANSDDGAQVRPCINEVQWLKYGVLPEYISVKPGGERCDSYSVENVSYSFEQGALRLDITLPQAYIKSLPRGYVPYEFWDEGETALFVNYNANYYKSEPRGSHGNSSESLYVGLNSGFNLGLWQVRNHSTYRYSDRGLGTGSDSELKNLRTYMRRPLPMWQSEFMVGELFTRNSLFDSLSFDGFQFSTDSQMLPPSQRGYAPVVNGIAQSTAKIVIKQNNREIYQTTVAPGPFEIRDLFPTSFQGDLLVEVTEADGRVSSFVVPFNAVPGALRPGQSQYALSMGKTRDVGEDDYFADFTYEIGLSNAITLNSGFRLADDYWALNGGTVFNTGIGSFGLNAIYSHSKISRYISYDESESGWRMGINYSRSFDSGTSVSLAGYRYSTEGYRELRDVLSQRWYIKHSGYEYMSPTFMQKDEITLNINQNFGVWGHLGASFSKRQYRNGRSDNNSYSLNYSNQFGPVSASLNYSRQYIGKYENDIQSLPSVKDDVWMLSLSMPLGSYNHSLTSSFSHASSGVDAYQLGLSGVITDDSSLSYSLMANHTSSDYISDNSFSGSLHQRTSLGSLGVNYSQGESYRQYGATASGAVVFHAGGVTIGQTVGDTFAIVEAEDAEGAAINNNWGTYINGSGYALKSGLTPYRSNDVTLDVGEMNDQVELLETKQSVVPYAGAAIKLRYATRHGIPVLFVTSLNDGSQLPIGTEVLGSQGENLGLVGQGGLAYVRLSDTQGVLTLRWGADIDQQCILDYKLPEKSEALLKLSAVCQQ